MQPTQPGAAAVPCARCRTAVDPARAFYSDRGEMICARCNAAADIQATEGRAVGYIQWAAFGNLGIGLFSFLFNPFLLVSVVAIVNAVYISISLLRDNWYRDRMGGMFGAAVACAIIGGVIGAIPVLLALLVMAFGIALM